MLARSFTHEGFEFLVRRGEVGDRRPVLYVDVMTPGGKFFTSAPIAPESAGRTETDEWVASQIETMTADEALEAVMDLIGDAE